MGHSQYSGNRVYTVQDWRVAFNEPVFAGEGS